MKYFNLLAGLCLLSGVAAHAQSDSTKETLLLRSPSLYQNQIAFAYAGDIWVAKKDGSQPRRLTIAAGAESNPVFSPDGQMIAFSGNYDGNTDVYVVSSAGGSPRRITYHPGSDLVQGWVSPDSILFSSSRISHSSRYNRLFAVGIKGGMPHVLPIPEAHQGSISSDGAFTAYIKNPDPTEARGVYRPFKNYRGGNAPRIWIFNNQTYDIEEIPHEGSNNTHPVWLGGNVYFLSDRAGATNVFSYDRQSKKITQITDHTDFDVKTLQTDGEELIYEQGGRIHLLDPGSSKTQTLHLALQPDIPSLRPHYADAQHFIWDANISPTGIRALLEIRGDIFTAPTAKGDARNITNSPGANDRYPAWSPDGKWIAFFSDQSGEYELKLSNQQGKGEVTTITLAENPTFYYDPVWSPDSKKIVYHDKNLQLYYVDIDEKKPVKIDTDTYSDPNQDFSPDWSPDGAWVTYTKRLDNQLSAVFLYHVSDGKIHQLTDGMSEATSPTFSADGKYIYFAASTDYGLNVSWLDMTNLDRPVTRSIYAIVLQGDQPSPFAPESDEEAVKAAAEADKEKKGEKDKNQEEESSTPKVEIDLENIAQRIIAFPLPARDYHQLDGSSDGLLFYTENIPNHPGVALHRYDLAGKADHVFMEGIHGYAISADGKKLIYAGNGGQFGIVGTEQEHAESGAGSINTGHLQVYVDPAQEWKQMFNEVWRIERDFFYVDNMHGADWPAIKKKYEKFLPYVGHREDLNYLLSEMMSEMAVGHDYVGQGDFPEEKDINVGLLGADFTISNGYYQFDNILSGLNWNPDFRAPLTEPGVQVSEGDYLLAVNGIPVTADTNLYSLFQNLADKQVIISIGGQPDLSSAEEFTVVPIADEGNLRNMAWVEGNRQKVEEMSDGRIAYVYMPNTGEGGYTFFNRYYFSQLDKEAVVVDERFNGGGFAADYVIDLLDRDLMNYWGPRDGKVTTTPGAAIFGPKAMIINGYAGSGGDLMPWLFKQKELGPLVGKRTMGILVGIFGYPPLMDGGFVTSPRFGIFSKEGEWIIENEGVSPDVEVEMTPKEVIEGKDPQLQKSVEILLKEIGDQKKTLPEKPASPVRSRQY